jgi:hypothetical protein
MISINTEPWSVIGQVRNPEEERDRPLSLAGTP